MDWWASCGAGSVADINQIEANFFDPWINGEELELGTIINQTAATSSTASSTPTCSPSTQTAQIILSSQTLSTAHMVGSPATNTSDGNNNIHLQNHGFLFTSQNNNTNSGNVNNCIPTNHSSSQQHQLQEQQQHIASTGNSNCRQNIFNIITNAAASAISSQTQNHLQNHQTPSSTLSPNITNPTSISSSQCSSTRSTASSLESSPIENNTISYLSSPSSSSPILIPASGSLLLADHEQDHQRSKPILQHHNLHQHGYSQLDCCQDPHTQSAGRTLETVDLHNQVLMKGANQYNNSPIDSKANLENMLHLASNNCDSSRIFHSRDQFLVGAQNENNHLLVVCPQSSANNAVVSTSFGTSSTTSTSMAAISSTSTQHRQSTIMNNNGSTKVSNKPSSGSFSVSSGSSKSGSASNSSSAGGQTTGQKLRRCRHITDYVLAEEEKRLLIKEGYTDFPMTCQARPLSKSEDRILRKIRRKIRNKKSAQCSRQRKKEYVEDLERKYAAVIRENEELKQVLEKIKQRQADKFTL